MLRPFSGYQEHIVAPVPFLWSEVFSTGNADLDSKHKVVFRLINALLQCEGVPGALECLPDLYKAFEEVFGAEEAYMDTLLTEQKGLTENLADRRADDDSEHSTLGSDNKSANDQRGLRYVHTATGKVIELDGLPLSEQLTDQHMTKHLLFLEDLESIKRRLDYNVASRRFEDDADFRGKRELEYIANWYIHHVNLDDATIRVSNTLCTKLRDGRVADAETLHTSQKPVTLDSHRPKHVVKFQTSDISTSIKQEPLTPAELDTLRHHPNLIFTRDWLAYLQEQFIVGICLLRLPRVGRSSRIVMANAVWTEFTRLYPWLAAKAQYNTIADGGDVINLKKGQSGICWVRKQKLFAGDNVRLRVISVAVPVRIRSTLFTTAGEYVADVTFFQSRDSIRSEESVIINSAFARQRTALLSKSYLGELSSQTLTKAGASLGWQHAPLGTALFDNLVAWLTVELLLDQEWMASEMPNIHLTVAPEILDFRHNELVISLRESTIACSRAKENEEHTSSTDAKLLNLPPRHATSHLSVTSEELGLSPLNTDLYRDNAFGDAVCATPNSTQFKSRMHLGRDDTLSDASDSKPPDLSEESSQPEVPLNALIQSFGAVSIATHVVDNNSSSQNDAVRDLANELGDLRKYIEPIKQSREKVPKKVKRPHKPRRKRLMD